MLNIKFEKLDEEIERNLPEAVRVIRKFYFEKLSKENKEQQDDKRII